MISPFQILSKSSVSHLMCIIRCYTTHVTDITYIERTIFLHSMSQSSHVLLLKCYRVATGNPVVFTLSPPECYMEIRHGYGTSGDRVGGPVHVGDPLTLIIYMRSKYGKRLTFIGPCIIIYFYNKTNQMHQFLKFISFYFGITRYMFRMVFPSIIRSSRLSIQHQVYVK